MQADTLYFGLILLKADRISRFHSSRGQCACVPFSIPSLPPFSSSSFCAPALSLSLPLSVYPSISLSLVLSQFVSTRETRPRNLTWGTTIFFSALPRSFSRSLSLPPPLSRSLAYYLLFSPSKNRALGRGHLSAI